MDDEVTIVADVFARIVLHADVHVFFRVHEELLAAGFVFEANFVEILAGSVLGAARDDSATGVVVGQGVGRHVVGVVDGAGDQGAVGIALEKLDYDFVTDAGPEVRTPGSAGPGLGDANPAGTVFIFLAETVPEKLDMHASVLVEETFFALLDGDNSGLRAGDEGFRGEAARPDFGIGLHANETVLIGGRSSAGDVVGILADRVTERGENVFAVRLKVLLELEFVAGDKLAAGGRAFEDASGKFFFFEADFVQLFAFRLHLSQAGIGGVETLRELAGVVIDFQIAVAERNLQIFGGQLEIVVAQNVLGGPDFFLASPAGDYVFALAHAAFRFIEHFAGIGYVDKRGIVVGKYKNVLVRGVLEVIEDAVLFHQARYEIEVGFTILSAVVEGNVIAGSIVEVVVETVDVKD